MLSLVRSITLVSHLSSTILWAVGVQLYNWQTWYTIAYANAANLSLLRAVSGLTDLPYPVIIVVRIITFSLEFGAALLF